MMGYFILEKTYCEDCKGTGLLPHQPYDHKGQLPATQDDCVSCKGKGFTFEPVELDASIIGEILR